jgi:anti-sigma factor RsiW
MTCEELAAQLTTFLEGELDEATEAAALDHLASCPACETVLIETRNVVELSRDHGRVQLTEKDRARMLSGVLGEVDRPRST